MSAEHINKLLPGFQMLGFGQQFEAINAAVNVAAVRATLPALVAKLGADGVTVTADAAAADLVAVWNGLCDELNAAAGVITITDYENCQIGHTDMLGVKWPQLCRALDRESAMDGDYAALLGSATVPRLGD